MALLEVHPLRAFHQFCCFCTIKTLSTFFSSNQIFAKDNAFSKQNIFFLSTHSWSVLISLFCLHVIFTVFIKSSVILKITNCSFSIFRGSSRKFEVDTISIVLSYLYHLGNVNQELCR